MFLIHICNKTLASLNTQSHLDDTSPDDANSGASPVRFSDTGGIGGGLLEVDDNGGHPRPTTASNGLHAGPRQQGKQSELHEVQRRGKIRLSQGQRRDKGDL